MEIRGDSIAAYRGVYSAIDRITGELYYNTLNSAAVAAGLTSGNWVKLSDGSTVVMASGNIISKGQNGWNRQDQLSFNTYNVGAHALKVMDANFYAAGNYKYNVSETYKNVNPTVTTDVDTFNPYDGLVSLREAIYLAGTTQVRNSTSSNPAMPSRYETFVFGTDITFNTNTDYLKDASGNNAFITAEGGNLPEITNFHNVNTLYLGTTYDRSVLGDDYYGALIFEKDADAVYSISADGLDLALYGNNDSVFRMNSGILNISDFSVISGGDDTATEGGIFDVNGGYLAISGVSELVNGNAQRGGVFHISGGSVVLGGKFDVLNSMAILGDTDTFWWITILLIWVRLSIRAAESSFLPVM